MPSKTSWRTLASSVVLVNVLAACGGEPTSEGVAAVTVDSVPFLSIGVEEGEEPYQLHRVTDAVQLPDGQVVLSNAGSQELRIFDSTGTYVRSLGRLGQGPMEFGEFSSLQLHARDGQLIAEDDGAMRLHVIGGDLAFKETRRISLYPDTPRPWLEGVTTSGEWIVQAYANGGAIRGEPGKLFNSTFQLLHYDSTGALRDTIIALPMRPRLFHEHDGRVRAISLPLWSEPLFAVDRDRLVVLSGDAPALEVYDVSGERIAAHAWNRPQRRAVEVWDEYKRKALASLSGPDSARYAAFYSLTLPLPEFAPMYVAAEADGSGRIWLERFRMPDETVRTWDIIDENGEWIGSAVTPPNVTVLRIARNVLVGRARDTLGVERVQLFRVR